MLQVDILNSLGQALCVALWVTHPKHTESLSQATFFPYEVHCPAWAALWTNISNQLFWCYRSENYGILIIYSEFKLTRLNITKWNENSSRSWIVLTPWTHWNKHYQFVDSILNPKNAALLQNERGPIDLWEKNFHEIHNLLFH